MAPSSLLFARGACCVAADTQGLKVARIESQFGMRLDGLDVIDLEPFIPAASNTAWMGFEVFGSHGGPATFVALLICARALQIFRVESAAAAKLGRMWTRKDVAPWPWGGGHGF